MPYFKAPTLESRWRHVKSAPWVGQCPQEFGRYEWMKAALKGCAKNRIPMETAVELVRSELTRPAKRNEIERLAAFYYSSDYKPGAYQPRYEPPAYHPDRLAEIAANVDFEVTDDWFAEQSPECVLDCQPHTILDALFSQEERVWCGKHDADSGYMYVPGDCGDAEGLAAYLKGSQQGAKYLVNPICGEEINGSVRSEPNLTSFRHLLLESDKAPRDLWLRMLVQIHAPLLALYDSGKRSVHALIRLTATSKAEFLEQADYYRRQLIPLGCDAKSSNKPVQLSRLPGVIRKETGQLQRLLYLDPEPDGSPIYKKQKPANATDASGF